MADRARDVDLLHIEGEALDRSCEACHGAGAAHANEPATANIRALKGATARAASAGCTTCHAAQAGGLLARTPGHVRAGIACLDCHVSGHLRPAGEPLLNAARSAVCAPCHGAETAQFGLPFAHREGRRPFECMSCHSVHAGTTARGRVEEQGREACIGCHGEKAGPYVFPHPPREVNGCVSCHRPHGSPNPRLLTRSDPQLLCLECHADTPSFHNLAQPKYRQCLTCHAAVHGSQRDRALFKE
jgi:DmsE family decaheme c-type cytochrome